MGAKSLSTISLPEGSVTMPRIVVTDLGPLIIPTGQFQPACSKGEGQFQPYIYKFTKVFTLTDVLSDGDWG